MKSFLFSALILFSGPTFAAVNVGTFVKHSVTLTEGTFKQVHTEESLVSSYNSTTDNFTVTETTLWQNYSPSVKTYEVSQADTVKLSQKFKGCNAMGGVQETVEVPAGKFAACAVRYNFSSEEGTVWFADAGFGVVKVETHFKGLKANRTRELVEAR
ncbi:MAG: hypothetical protein ACKOX6_10675 [Bdellovibrio sp.]